MVSWNGLLFIAVQCGSRFANTFLSTLVRYELLELGGVTQFANAQVANQVVRVFTQQIAGVLAANYSLKKLYVGGEACNFILVLAVLYTATFETGIAMVLFLVNMGLGVTQAFSQPIAKSMPPAVVSAQDLAVVNSWDLTGDKIGRNLAPMAFTVVSSALGFRMAIVFSFGLYFVIVAMKQLLAVEDTQNGTQKTSGEASGVNSKVLLRRMLGVFWQVWKGMKSLESDRVVGLLILNTLITNMIVYPLGSIVFPVIFKAVPDGAIEQEGSRISAIIMSVQDLVGIHKKKAWMNYAALVALGGVVGPFVSPLLVYQVQFMSRSRPEEATWVGLNFGILGQTVTLIGLVVCLHFVQSLSAGVRILSLFAIWSVMSAMNNITTIYFNSHSQQRLSRDERASFIANILTLFTMANSLGSLLYGYALASSDAADVQVSTSNRILCIAVVARLLLLGVLRSDLEGRKTVLLQKKDG